MTGSHQCSPSGSLGRAHGAGFVSPDFFSFFFFLFSFLTVYSDFPSAFLSGDFFFSVKTYKTFCRNFSLTINLLVCVYFVLL